MLNPNYNSKESFEDMIKLIRKAIKENNDPRTKEIGDKVLIWDFSWNKDKNTGEHCSINDKTIVDTPGIVIDTNCDILADDTSEPIQLDLLVKFPAGEEVYVASNCVKRIDTNKI